jgi:hypothetical protein
VVDDVEHVADGATGLVDDGSRFDLLRVPLSLGPVGRFLGFLGVLLRVLGRFLGLGRRGVGAVRRCAGLLGCLFGL